MRLTSGSGSPITLGRDLGGGGEGTVHLVVGQPGLVAKTYRSAAPEQKLAWMVEHPPASPFGPSAGNWLAWPSDLVRDAGGACVGFLMPRIVDYRKLYDVYHPATARRVAPDFDWRYRHIAAQNTALGMQAIHDSGYVIGDVNESNVLVSKRALVAFVDTDSFQVVVVRGNRRKVFHCQVAREEFLPPELKGVDLSKALRTPEQDRFGLAVLTFQLLFGEHPFSARWLGTGDTPPMAERMSSGLFPYARSRSPLVAPSGRVAYGRIHPDLANLFEQAFVAGYRDPSLRPTGREWAEALRLASRQLRKCPSGHVYSSHLPAGCPNCKPKPRPPQPKPPPNPPPPPQPPVPQVPARRSVNRWLIVASVVAVLTVGWVLGHRAPGRSGDREAIAVSAARTEIAAARSVPTFGSPSEDPLRSAESTAQPAAGTTPASTPTPSSTATPGPTSTPTVPPSRPVFAGELGCWPDPDPPRQREVGGRAVPQWDTPPRVLGRSVGDVKIATTEGDVMVQVSDLSTLATAQFVCLTASGFYDGAVLDLDDSRALVRMSTEDGEPVGPGYEVPVGAGSTALRRGDVVLVQERPGKGGGRFVIVLADVDGPLPPRFNRVGKVTRGLEQLEAAARRQDTPRIVGARVEGKP